jgi:spore germination protein (amino acid permease)
MNDKANEISSSQVFQFIVSGQIGFGILSIASTLAKDVGHDGWIAITLAGVITSLSTYIIVATLKRFNNNSIVEINRLVWGKYLGLVINLIVIAYVTYSAVLMLRKFNNIIALSALRITPPLVITGFIIIPVIYLSWYGLKYICRFSTLQVILIVSVALYYLLLLKYFRFTFLQPIGAAGAMKIIKISFSPFTSFIGYELLTFIYPYIKDKKKLLKSALYANAFTVIFYIITVTFLTGFFGEVMLAQLLYPVFSLARAYRAPVFERLDLFFISLWFPIMLTTLLVYYFCAYNSLKRFFNIVNNKQKSKILIWCFTIVVIMLSRLPKDSIQLDKLFNQLGYISTGYVGYIFILYLLSFIKRGDKKNETST